MSIGARSAKTNFRAGVVVRFYALLHGSQIAVNKPPPPLLTEWCVARE